jgi:hypothetical protein
LKEHSRRRCPDATPGRRSGRLHVQRVPLALPSLRPLSRKWIAYKIFGSFLRSLGRLSEGIRLGWRSGFNSGRTLDYVYRNQPSGTHDAGRFIDRQYLNGIGWRAIRVRRQLVERAIKHAIDDRHAANGSAHIVDIATGAGRYLLDTLKRCTSLQLTAELRDAEASNLDAGRAIARSLELTNVIFTRADAFDRSALEHIDPIPDVAIVSGLYELFPDNRRVLNSLEGLARAIPEGTVC